MPVSTSAKKFQLPHALGSGINQDAYEAFLHQQCDHGKASFLVFNFLLPDHTPADLTALIRPDEAFCFFWSQPDLPKQQAALGILQRITAKGTDRFLEVQNQLEALELKVATFSENGESDDLQIVGGFSFADAPHGDAWQSFGSASFVLPEIAVTRTADHQHCSVGIPLSPSCTPNEIHDQLCAQLTRLFEKIKNYNEQENDIGPSVNFWERDDADTEKKRWTGSVEKARNAIRRHSMHKVVLARKYELRSSRAINHRGVVDALQQAYPNCATFYVHFGGPAFLGSTPERLMSFHANTLYTEALAGSIPRGRTEDEDQMLAQTLSSSAKNLQEHRVVVRAVEEELLNTVDDVAFSEQPVIKKLANVQHLCTPFRARKEDLNPLMLLRHLHPTPAVGGYPRAAALDFIRTQENFDRGWYAAPLGWMNTKGDGAFMVAIRSGLLQHEKATLYAGCGIVEDSDPEAEWEETNLKLEPMLSALRHG